MANYALPLTRTASTSASVGTLASNASTPRRGEIYDISVSSPAAPADNAFLWTLQRFTAPGTNTGVTPSPLDPADAACSSAAGQVNTVEPTYTSNLVVWDIATNQRATFRWIATEHGRLIYPATANNGFGLQTPTSSAVTVQVQIYFTER